MNPFVPNIALVSTSATRTPAQLERYAAAYQILLTRDYAPVWQRTARVMAFHDINVVPEGWWKMVWKDDIGQPGALGFHIDENNQPVAYIDVNPEDDITGSHELLEMVTDPSGNRLIQVILRGRRVQLLCEVCDPNEAESYVINGVNVTNFYKPTYFGFDKGETGKCDFLGNNRSPLYVNEGGYISYMIGKSWYQDTFFQGSQPVTRGPLNMIRQPGQSLRTMVDQFMMNHNWENTI